MVCYIDFSYAKPILPFWDKPPLVTEFFLYVYGIDLLVFC